MAVTFPRASVRKGLRQRLLWHRDHTPRLSTSITPAEVDQAHADALRLPWTDQSKEMLEEVLRELAREGIQPGDRRQFKSVAAAQGFAYLCGGERVEPEHLEVLAHTLWDDPQEQPEKTHPQEPRVGHPRRRRNQRSQSLPMLAPQRRMPAQKA